MLRVVSVLMLSTWLGGCQSMQLQHHGHTEGAPNGGVTFSQALRFSDSGLEVCAGLENAAEARWVLRSPLGFGGAGQIRALMGPELKAPIPPQGPAPADDDLLSYDLLEPLETRKVCTVFSIEELPDAPFRLEVLYQPWSQQGDSLPLGLAFRPGVQLLEVPPGGFLSGACMIDPDQQAIRCDAIEPA